MDCDLYLLFFTDVIFVLSFPLCGAGIEKLRFKPAYNPYTEPSMEVFSYHEGLKKWVEVGNSGVFRPEMLLPMGLPEDVVVIAWGLSLERYVLVFSPSPSIIKGLRKDKLDMIIMYKSLKHVIH